MDWAERFAKVRRWRRGGERAPQKPLLLLYALGYFQRHGDSPIVYSEAEEQLGRLLREFGPPRKTTAAYPFHHLTSDGLWTVTTAGGGGSPGDTPTALRSQQAAGRLVPDVAWSLRADPQLLPKLAHVLLDTNFPPSLHEDLCAAVGLDLEEAESTAAGDDRQPRRDPDFPRVLVAYEYRCAFCGYDGVIDDGSWPGLEAAHVRHHFGGSRAEITAHPFTTPANVLRRVVVTGWAARVDSGLVPWPPAVSRFVAWLDDNATGAAGYFLISVTGTEAAVERLDWFDASSYDLGYQSVIAVREVPVKGALVFGIQPWRTAPPCPGARH